MDRGRKFFAPEGSGTERAEHAQKVISGFEDRLRSTLHAIEDDERTQYPWREFVKKTAGEFDKKGSDPLESKVAMALAAEKSFPANQNDRSLLLEEFKHRPNARFGDRALIVLSAYTDLQSGLESRRAKLETTRQEIFRDWR